MNSYPIAPAPHQDNFQAQKQNPNHPAYKANQLALALIRNSPRVSAATPAQIRHGQQFNLAPNNGTYFTPRQNRMANQMERRNAPLNAIGNHVEHFLGLKQLGQQSVQMFNPTTRAGLVNILSMFAGGPKDGGFEGEMAMQKVPGQFEAYKGQGSPLLRGLTHEGPIRPGKNYNPSIEKMVGNAKGVGGYRRANPMDVIEGLHAARQKLGQTSDSIKDYSNRGGFAARQAQERTNNFMRVDRAMGANSVPYVPRGEGRPFYDTQPADFRDRNTLLNLQKKMPDNPLLGDSNPIMQALYDMLFPGKGLLRKPTRPGGYPYGGGPFG